MPEGSVYVSSTLFHVDHEVGRAFAWISIGLAILTSFFQGLVTAIASMTEASNRWTFRFRLALVEHWWWTFVSALLLASLIMNALSFSSGNGGEAISVLALSTATFLAIVKYTVPAWQERHYTQTRWLAWTGPSRTAILKHHAGYCGTEKKWRQLISENRSALNQLQMTPSDSYGWQLWPVRGIDYDPTDILNTTNSSRNSFIRIEDGERDFGLYANGDETNSKVSLRWGKDQGFRRRVSRAVSSMPLGLLSSYPVTVDGYDGKGLATAMGILGRNKGLDPKRLVFKMSSAVSAHMENSSTWRPRPAKVLRSFFNKTLADQYGGLGTDFVAAATELALLLADMPYWAVDHWLQAGLEHQCLETNKALAQEYLRGDDVTAQERQDALDAHYHSSYASMIISLNNMDTRMKDKRRDGGHLINRPDLLCLGLLLKARGHPKPSWWNHEDVRERRRDQLQFLGQSADWKMPVAKLLGLEKWPEGFDEDFSIWGSAVETDSEQPDYGVEAAEIEPLASDTEKAGSTVAVTVSS